MTQPGEQGINEMTFDVLARVLAQELTKLIHYEDSRTHLRMVSNALDIMENVKTWHEVRRPDAVVKIMPMPGLNMDSVPRSMFHGSRLLIYSNHVDFLLRSDGGGGIGARLPFYVSLVAAEEYVAKRDKDEHLEDRASRIMDVACQLEESISRRLEGLRTGEK